MSWLLLGALVLLPSLAARFGVDSRQSRDWRPTCASDELLDRS